MKSPIFAFFFHCSALAEMHAAIFSFICAAPWPECVARSNVKTLRAVDVVLVNWLISSGWGDYWGFGGGGGGGDWSCYSPVVMYQFARIEMTREEQEECDVLKRIFCWCVQRWFDTHFFIPLRLLTEFFCSIIFSVFKMLFLFLHSIGLEGPIKGGMNWSPIKGGMNWAPIKGHELVPHYAERRHPLGQPM